MSTRPLPAHGTQTRYKGARNGSYPPCRCTPCTRAHSLGCKKRSLAHLAGTPPLYPAEPLREHIATLSEAGMSCNLIARRARVSHSTIRYIVRGLTQSCRREKALRILAVTPGDFDGTAERPVEGTMRRVRAMYYMGHNPQVISAASGVTASTISGIANGHHQIVQSPTAAAIAAAYRVLSTRTGTSAKAKRRAVALGWHGPLAWDDIDNPATVPDAPMEPELTKPAEAAPRELAPCGTTAAYRRHQRRNERIDAACRAANLADGRAREARRKAAAIREEVAA